MSADQNMASPGKRSNPFAGGGVSAAADGPAAEAEVLRAALGQARRSQRNQLLVALTLLGLLAAGTCWYINEQLTRAHNDIQTIRNAVALNGQYALLGASNYLLHARLAANQASFAAEQTRRDRESVVALRVESATTLTNASLDLARRLQTQLNQAGQSNLMAFDLNYAARLKGYDDYSEKQRQEVLKFFHDQFKQLKEALGKYDALLRIDPDVAERIDTALKQLSQLVEITAALKTRAENDVKGLQNQMAILAEKIKVLELQLANVQAALGKLAAPTNTPAAPPPAPPKPAP